MESKHSKPSQISAQCRPGRLGQVQAGSCRQGQESRASRLGQVQGGSCRHNWLKQGYQQNKKKTDRSGQGRASQEATEANSRQDATHLHVSSEDISSRKPVNSS